MDILFSSERMFFRKFDVSDAQIFYELNLDKEVMKYTGDVPFESIAASAEFLKNYDPYLITGYGRWTVVLKESQEVIGWCGLKRLEDGTVDLGYRFFRKHWNKGLATEAAIACIKEGFTTYQLTEIIGRTAADNIGSIRVLEKTGMSYWKVAPCEGIQNSVFYKISNERN